MTTEPKRRLMATAAGCVVGGVLCAFGVESGDVGLIVLAVPVSCVVSVASYARFGKFTTYDPETRCR